MLYPQEQQCQGGLYCLYSPASNNWRGNSGNDCVYFARSWSGNRECQGYDGAANMSSNNVGVRHRIREHSTKAVYVHSSGQ